MVYILNKEISDHADCEIYYSGTGKGFYENSQLHIIEKTYHFVGKPDKGWYMIGQADNKEYYLGEGACPVVDIIDVEIQNTTVFNSIMTERKTEDVRKGKKSEEASE